MAKLVSFKRKREFDVVFQQGRRGGNRSLGVLVMAGEPGAGVRYGLVALPPGGHHVVAVYPS